jgi:hypothetical protein
MHLARAQFWPDGVLPIGPEYAEFGPIEPAGNVRLVEARKTGPRLVADGRRSSR